VYFNDEAVGEENIRKDGGTSAEEGVTQPSVPLLPLTKGPVTVSGKMVGLIWKRQLESENTHG